jgi:hypothetical protein
LNLASKKNVTTANTTLSSSSAPVVGSENPSAIKPCQLHQPGSITDRRILPTPRPGESHQAFDIRCTDWLKHRKLNNLSCDTPPSDLELVLKHPKFLAKVPPHYKQERKIPVHLIDHNGQARKLEFHAAKAANVSNGVSSAKD